MPLPLLHRDTREVDILLSIRAMMLDTRRRRRLLETVSTARPLFRRTCDLAATPAEAGRRDTIPTILWTMRRKVRTLAETRRFRLSNFRRSSSRRSNFRKGPSDIPHLNTRLREDRSLTGRARLSNTTDTQTAARLSWTTPSFLLIKCSKSEETTETACMRITKHKYI